MCSDSCLARERATQVLQPAGKGDRSRPRVVSAAQARGRWAQGGKWQPRTPHGRLLSLPREGGTARTGLYVPFCELACVRGPCLVSKRGASEGAAGQAIFTDVWVLQRSRVLREKRLVQALGVHRVEGGNECVHVPSCISLFMSLGSPASEVSPLETGAAEMFHCRSSRITQLFC